MVRCPMSVVKPYRSWRSRVSGSIASGVGAVLVGLVGQPTTWVHVDALDLVAVVDIDDLPRAPRPIFAVEFHVVPSHWCLQTLAYEDRSPAVTGPPPCGTM